MDSTWQSEVKAFPASAEERPWIIRIERELVEPARRGGLTTELDVYLDSYRIVFAFLDELDGHLHRQRYLSGNAIGPADLALAFALARFDPIYYPLCKMNRQRLGDFQNLAHYLRDIAQTTEFQATFSLERAKRAAYLDPKAELINPKGRLPLADIDFDRPHDRAYRFQDTDTSATEENPLGAKRPGEFVRGQSAHRSWIGEPDFPPERDRYHLIIANNCPWCHRVALTRSLKHLEAVVSMDVAFYRRDPERGWQFNPEEPGCTNETLYGYRYVRELYERIESSEKSVPILWDKKRKTIVNNESAEIIRMFDAAFDSLAPETATLVPEELKNQINRLNAFTYHAINNGAYKAGFSSSQGAYEAAHQRLFEALDVVEEMLRGRRFLLGTRLTEADVRLFPTIFRFDAVYFTRFNLDARQIRDLPNTQRWLEHMLAIPEIASASNLDHARKGYFGRTGNELVPLGPEIG
ncbi:MAG: glutathione S-transferase C-terminal domain-containing protein [Myxococcota bacterium]